MRAAANPRSCGRHFVAFYFSAAAHGRYHLTMDDLTARRVDAMIAALIAESARVGDERRKLHDENAKLCVGAAKVVHETFTYPALIGAGLMGAGAALFAALSKLLP